MSSKRILMCPPDFFDIEYEINPWMHTDDPVDRQATQQQWDRLKAEYQRLDYAIEIIEPVKHLPDMVFTANGGLVIDGRAMLPRFKFEQRQPETEYFRRWFEEHGFETRMPEYDFEGEGDALVVGDIIFAGWGFRSDRRSHAELDQFFDETVVSLHLVNEHFYHLDTALAVLDPGTVAYYPGAFDQNSQQAIEQAIPRTIKASAKEAEGFGLNAVSDGHHVVMSDQATTLATKIEGMGFEVHPTPITEFRKSGGGVKCLTLELRG